MTPFISATEKIFRELSQPKPPQPKPASAPADAKPVALTRNDVDEIIHRKRTASTEELEYAIANARDFQLSEGAINQLRVDLTLVVAQRPQKSWRTAWRNLTRLVQCPACGRQQRSSDTCRNSECKADLKNVKSLLAGLRFHDLKHHAVTELAESQASDCTIMAIAGARLSKDAGALLPCEASG
jgi:hypothetical protein